MQSLDRKQEGWRDERQICLHGHTITSSSVFLPDTKKEYCGICGMSTITSCRFCSFRFPGNYYLPADTPSGFITLPPSPEIPSYCPNCGQPFPWIAKALEVVLGDEKLTDSEKIELAAFIEDVFKTPIKSDSKIPKIKELFRKMAKPSSTMIQQIFVNFASEFAKKVLLEG